MHNVTANETALHRIVIVGGGAGGLELATRLGQSLGKRNKAHIILVDAALTHIWKPLLHEVAAGTINSYEDELNYFAHASKHHFEFHLGRLSDINRTDQHIVLQAQHNEQGVEIAPERQLSYDTLVMAVGSTANDFGTAGAQEHCIFLDARAQADRFQREFLSLYLQAQARTLSADNEQQHLNIAIIGAGATGVELAAELHHAAHEFNRYGLTSIDSQHVNITLIEAADRILPNLPERTSAAAQRELDKKGITTLTGRRVMQITADSVICDGDVQLDANLKVWSAGIKAPDFLNNIAGLETNRINQLVVDGTLQTTRDPNIFAMGDCASYTPQGETRAVPPRAQVANQESILLAKSMKARLNGKPLPIFKFMDKGSLISLSKRNSVGNLMGDINIQGMMARLMYISLYRMHQVAIHGFFKTSVLVCKDVLSYSSSAKLKMH